MAQRALLNQNEAQALVLADTDSPASSASVVSRTVLQALEMRVIRFDFADGQELTTHTSKRRALVQIVSGECEFFFADKWQRLNAGTLVHLPPNHPHAVRASAGPFSMLLTLGSEAASDSSSSSHQ